MLDQDTSTHSISSGTVVRYDETSPSCLRWMVRPSPHIYPGDVAGTCTQGYWRVHYKRKGYSAHRIVWQLHHGSILPSVEIDHIDGNPSNNLISNLRVACRSTNLFNRGKMPSNTSGYKGVSWNKLAKKWYATIRAFGKRYTIGSYTTKEAAATAYRLAAEELHKEFAKYD